MGEAREEMGDRTGGSKSGDICLPFLGLVGGTVSMRSMTGACDRSSNTLLNFLPFILHAGVCSDSKRMSAPFVAWDAAMCSGGANSSLFNLFLFALTGGSLSRASSSDIAAEVALPDEDAAEFTPVEELGFFPGLLAVSLPLLSSLRRLMYVQQ